VKFVVYHHKMKNKFALYMQNLMSGKLEITCKFSPILEYTKAVADPDDFFPDPDPDLNKKLANLYEGNFY
jgi:hypothetical protein